MSEPPKPPKPVADVKLVGVDLSTGAVTRVALQFWSIGAAISIGVYAVLQVLSALTQALR